MGFFSKIVKGIKKVFKKIGKAVKGVFKKVGKFMGKIGIVGQLGLMLIAPYAMPMLGSMATSMMGTSLGGISGAIVKGAGQFLNAAVKVGTRVGQVFKTVTNAVTGTLKNVVGATLNKVPGMGDLVKNISGWDIKGLDFKDAFEKSGKLWTDAGDDLSQLFSKSTLDSSMNKFSLEKSIAEGIERTGALEVDPDRFAYDTGVGVDLPQQQNVFPARSGLEYSEALAGPQAAVPDYLDYQAAMSPTATESLLSPMAPASAPVPAPTQIGASYQAPLPGKETLELAEKIGAGVKTSYEATAWEKTKEFAASKGLPTTAGGLAMTAAEYAAQEPIEFGPTPLPYDTFVDRSRLQPSLISPEFSGGGQVYPTRSGSSYAQMMAPTMDYTSQMFDSIINQDFTSIYEGGYYGWPSVQATLADQVQGLLYE